MLIEKTRCMRGSSEDLGSMMRRAAEKTMVYIDDEPVLVDLLKRILVYSPSERLNHWDVMAHDFFDKLRSSSSKLPNGKPLPPNLFTFSSHECESMTTGAQRKFNSSMSH